MSQKTAVETPADDIPEIGDITQLDIQMLTEEINGLLERNALLSREFQQNQNIIKQKMMFRRAKIDAMKKADPSYVDPDQQPAPEPASDGADVSENQQLAPIPQTVTSKILERIVRRFNKTS